MNRHTTTLRTRARALRQRWLQRLLALLCLLTAGGAGEAWARHDYLTKIDYESATDASSWTSENYGGGLTLITGDATYGKYLQFAQSGSSLSGPRTAHTDFSSISYTYSSYMVEFDAAVRTSNDASHFTELVVAADGYALKGNNYFTSVNDDNKNYLFLLKSNGTASTTKYIINETSDELTIADNTWFHVKLSVDISNRRVYYWLTGAVTANGSYSVTDGSSMEAKALVATIGRGSNGMVKIDNIEIFSLWYYLKTDAPTTLVSTGGAEGVTVSHAYPHYVLSGTTLYRYASTGVDPNYQKTFTLTATDNQEVTLTHDGSPVTHVTAYSEAEDFMTPVTGNAYQRNRCSMMQGGYANSYVNALWLPAGVYYLTAASYANSSTSFTFRVAGSDVFTHTGNGGWSESRSEPITMPTNGYVQAIGGSRNYVLDYLYAQAIFAYQPAYGEMTYNAAATTPTLLNGFDMTGYTLRYWSGNLGVATVDSLSGAITPRHNGTAVITAQIMAESETTKAHKDRAINCVATFTVTVTGETEATCSFTPTPATTTETFTVTGNGALSQTYEGTMVSVAFGSTGEVQVAESITGTTSTKTGVKCIDTNGYTHVYVNDGIPAMGSYYAVKPSTNGVLSFWGFMTEANAIRLTDAEGSILERISASQVTAGDWKEYSFGTLLNSGDTYYVYAETKWMTPHDGETTPSLYLNSLTLTYQEGITINVVDQSLLFTPNNNGNYQRLDRDIPGFKLEFNGDGVKYQNKKDFIVRHTDAANSYIQITPRIETASDIEITSVKVYYDNSSGTFHRTPKLTVSNKDGSVSEEKTLSTEELSQTWTGSWNSVKIRLTNSEAQTETLKETQFLLKAISITYNLKNSATLNMSKQPVDLKFDKDYVYGYEGDVIENKFWVDSPMAYYGDVTFYGNVARYGSGTGFANGNSHEVTKVKDANNKTYYRDTTAEPDEEYKVRIGQGVCMLQATTTETPYFAPGYAETRLYSRDYVEQRTEEAKLVLHAGDTYKVPAASGLSFSLTATSEADAGAITLNGVMNGAVTANGTAHQTTATGDEVTITNSGTADVTITRIEVSRKKGTLTFAYDKTSGLNGDILFCGERYLPTIFTITGEEGIADKYAATGTYTITAPLTGVSINASSGELTIADNATDGQVDVTLTVSPLEAYKADYGPVSCTLRLTVVDGMWDFRTYSRTEHYTMYNSTGWSGQYGGWYAARDIADFAYILRNDDTPLPRALGLMTKGKHRLLHTDHGYLHLQGRGVGAYQSPNGGGQLLIPVKEGMLVEVNAYSEDLLSEMEIEGVTTLDGTDVSTFYVDPAPAASQLFLAKGDGYVVVRNPSFNLDLHICYVKATAEMAFKYGNETYVDAQAGTWSNPVMNQGATILTHTYSNQTSDPVSAINAATGQVTIGSGKYGVFNVTVNGSVKGLLAGKTGTYTAHVIGFAVSDLSLAVSASNVFNLKERVTITGTDGSEDASLKDLVTFSLDSPVPSATLAGATLTVDDVQTVTVRATLGSISKTFNCSVTGGTLEGGTLNPVIANTTSEYKITLAGDVTAVSESPYGGTLFFDIDQMKSRAMGDIKASVNNFDFSQSGKVLTINFKLSEGATIPGGVIPIIAKYHYDSNDYTIRGTLTVPYSSHIWRFQHNLLTGMDTTAEDAEEAAGRLADDALAGYGSSHGLTDGLYGWQTNDGSKTEAWDSEYATIDEPAEGGVRSDSYNWKFVRKIGGHPESSMIYYYNHPVEGDNALVIPETEGLHIYASPSNRQMGVEMQTTNGVATAPYSASNLMILRGGRVTIPKVKAGQWIEVRWTRHKEDEAERVLMHNLSDFEGTPITQVYKIGYCFYNYPWSTSTYMFKATADGDVTFEVADNIYISIQQIELHDPSWNPVSSIVTQLNGYDDTTTPTEEEKEAWTATTANHVEWQYVWDNSGPHDVTILAKHLQNAPNAPQTWDFEIDDMLRQEGATMTYDALMDHEAVLHYNGGWGKVHITMTCYSQNMKYVANKKSWTITFGQAPHQTYPYTWDFTKYFDTTQAGIGTDSWSSGSTATTKTAIHPNYNTQNYTTSYYVEGAQLVSYALRGTNNGVLPETGGLGFKLDTSGDGVPDATLSLDMQSTTGSRSANGPYRAPTTGSGNLTLTGGGTIIVPKPGDSYGDYYIYIKSSAKPSSVTNATEVTSDYATTNSLTYDVDGSTQHRYRFTANANAEITFSGDATVYALGVTNMFKPMTPLSSTAWATESRDCAIDHTLTGVLTTNDTHAYAVIERTGNPVYSDDKKKTTVSVSDERFVVPATNGLVLKQTEGVPASAYNVPLFVPAVTTSTDATYLFANNLMRPNVTETTFDSETENYNGNSYTRFILANRYMTWRKNGDSTPTYDEHFTTGNVAAFYRMHLYDNTSYDSGTDRNTLGANKAYLLLNTSKISPAIWNSASPSRQWAGIEGVSDFDEDITDEERQNNTVYNLRGQAVDTDGPLPPGIYIRNGRKIVIK